MKRWIAVMFAVVGVGGRQPGVRAGRRYRGPARVVVTFIPGGATFFTEGKDTKEPSFGNYGLGGGVDVNFNRYVGVEGEVSGALGVTQDLQFTSGDVESARRRTSSTTAATWCVSAANHSSVVPYVTGGVGGLDALRTRPASASTSTETFLTGNVGGGVKWLRTAAGGCAPTTASSPSQSKDDAPTFLRQETRYGHRVYGGVAASTSVRVRDDTDVETNDRDAGALTHARSSRPSGFVKFKQIQTAIAQGAAFQPPPEAVTTIVAAEEEWPSTLTRHRHGRGRAGRDGQRRSARHRRADRLRVRAVGPRGRRAGGARHAAGARAAGRGRGAARSGAGQLRAHAGPARTSASSRGRVRSRHRRRSGRPTRGSARSARRSSARRSARRSRASSASATSTSASTCPAAIALVTLQSLEPDLRELRRAAAGDGRRCAPAAASA